MEALADGAETWAPRLKALETSLGLVPKGARKQITCEFMDEVSSIGIPIVETAPSYSPATALFTADEESLKLALNNKPLSEADSNDMGAVDEADA